MCVPRATLPAARGRPEHDGDVESAPASPSPAGALLHLALAAGVSIVVLRAITMSAGAAAGRTPAPPAVHDMPSGMTAARPLGPGGSARAATPVPAAQQQLPPRTHFANLVEAGDRLGFRVWQPQVLPPGAGPLAVAWQPDGPVLVPGLPPTGTLLAWYFTWQHGVMLVLGQGPGIGLSDAGAPPGEHGTATLADGRRVVWVRGHQGAPDDPRGPTRRWAGDELRVGVAPTSGQPGWWIESKLLPLEELLRVAEGLR